MSEKMSSPENAMSVAQAEIDDEFHRIADERWAKLLITGKTVSLADALAYLEARSRDDSPQQ